METKRKFSRTYVQPNEIQFWFGITRSDMECDQVEYDCDGNGTFKLPGTAVGDLAVRAPKSQPNRHGHLKFYRKGKSWRAYPAVENLMAFYQPTHEQIEKRAYEIYEQRGRADGHADDDWAQAERELRGER